LYTRGAIFVDAGGNICRRDHLEKTGINLYGARDCAFREKSRRYCR
jgi:hypothetical protein